MELNPFPPRGSTFEEPTRFFNQFEGANPKATWAYVNHSGLPVVTADLAVDRFKATTTEHGVNHFDADPENVVRKLLGHTPIRTDVSVTLYAKTLSYSGDDYFFCELPTVGTHLFRITEKSVGPGGVVVVGQSVRGYQPDEIIGLWDNPLKK